MPEIIHLNFANQSIDFKSKTIEFAPEGIHQINPGVAGGGSVTIEVAVNSGLAEKLNADLQQRIKTAEEGNASRPFIDFDHKGGRAAGIPTRFYWEDGIRLELEWTKAGQDAIEGREYSYFSPELMFNRETKEIRGLPQLGSIGSLVNTPAFQKIERLAAASSHKPKPTPDMDPELEKVKAQLAAAEAQLVNSQKDNTRLQAELDSTTAERDEVKGKFEKLEADHKDLTDSSDKLQAAADEARKAKIEAAVEAKGIKEENREDIVKACLASDDDGEKILAAFEAPKPKGHPPLDKSKKQEKKVEPTGFAKLTASISENLKGLK